MSSTPPLTLAALTTQERAALAVQAPGAFYMTGEDLIELAAINSRGGCVITLAGRFITIEGRIVPFEHTFTPTTDRVIGRILRGLGEGWLQHVTVYSSSGDPSIGMTWARVRIVRGQTGATLTLGALCAGYVTSQQPIAFPGGKVRGSLDSPGVVRSITGTDPAAGAEIGETVPTGARWRLLALRAALVTDATVANREAQLLFDDGTNVFASVNAERAHGASTTITYTFAQTGALWDGAVVNQTNIPTPPLILLAGYRVRTVTQNLQAGDNWGAPQLLVEERLNAD